MNIPFTINTQSTLRLRDDKNQVHDFSAGDEEACYNLVKSSEYRLQKVLRSGSTKCLQPELLVSDTAFKQLEADYLAPKKKTVKKSKTDQPGDSGE